MIHDFPRVFVANLTHRRMIDPMSLRRWKDQRPFEIIRADTTAASAHPEQAQRANVVEADVRQDIAR